jgi:hypothetical protein
MNSLCKLFYRVLGLALLCAASGGVSAVGTSGAASSIVIPLISKSSSFESEVFVFNHNAEAIEVDVLYYEANNSSVFKPGLIPCTLLSLAAGETKSFKLGAQCPGANDGNSRFGLMVLRDHSAVKVNTFYAYSRTQHVLFLQGFSVEGFPEHVFSGATATAGGLKRSGTPTSIGGIPPSDPLYQSKTNCFVGSLGDPVKYVIRVNGANGTKIGSDISGTLTPYQLLRYSDIFTLAGVASGAFVDARVTFEETTSSAPNGPAMIGYCTVQDNTLFGADFRIAKSVDAANITQKKLRCRGMDANCVALSASAPVTGIPNGSLHRWSMFVHHPDWLTCSIVGPTDKLEMRLYSPDGAARAGGNNAFQFYVETGGRQAAFIGDGSQMFWTLDVSPKEGLVPPYSPVDYGLVCESGSGIHLSGTPITVSPDEF